jgi:hypothetical protein
MHGNKSENPCRNIVEYDPGAFWKSLQLSYRGRLHDIEGSKKYKTGEKSFPCERDSNERDQLAGDFVDDDELGIFDGGGAGHAGGGGDANQGYEYGECDSSWGLQRGRYSLGGGGPDQHGGGGCAGSGAGMEVTDSAESRDECCP